MQHLLAGASTTKAYNYRTKKKADFNEIRRGRKKVMKNSLYNREECEEVLFSSDAYRAYIVKMFGGRDAREKGTLRPQ